MVMSSHIKFSQIDPEWPVTLSEIFIKDLMRKKLNYSGLVITDDLGMKAMADHFGAEQIPVRAIQAGAELLLYCNEPSTPPLAIEALLKATEAGALSETLLQKNHQKILNIKSKHLREANPLPLEKVLEIVGCPQHLQMAEAILKGEMPEGLLSE